MDVLPGGPVALTVAAEVEVRMTPVTPITGTLTDRAIPMNQYIAALVSRITADLINTEAHTSLHGLPF